MEPFSPSDLKTILHSKRANLYYLEHCRVLVNSGRVEYLTEQGKNELYWNIPIANTTSILLGTGTSITQAAMRELAKAGVLVGFCGGGGTPLFSANECEMPISWLTPQSEYRPTEYVQQWAKFWFDEDKRLEAAKRLQIGRLTFLKKQWCESGVIDRSSFLFERESLDRIIQTTTKNIQEALSVTELLANEGRCTKQLYKLAAQAVEYNDFTRQQRGIDPANRLLDHGNYLAYGLAATATWVLGIPHGFAILHGKTRRGGLVFDVADLIKDALILPQAFMSALSGDEDNQFRQKCLQHFRKTDALDFMIDELKSLAADMSGETS
ncbi:type I-F CRISPR-associated endonuclease Cas1f [Marinibactrum halimedae]|uniref:CRISPR-associated endonuclease Cas1 n=1 Tax=Marinibactrum halimedae TaxID=1444977 RepID=A0AA37WNV1_9GAMM|nr:type I-F CRISPR-associated endonuclease Cas1f [Marinibactrum halimedae]MCD9460217.1 type I-F CRISPR-associated endonuclease Cas1f [Marinibactrum halimedae]GLS27950.1 hypothetical protein GCM10007877_36690 [Marinibactrum halimedae]